VVHREESVSLIGDLTQHTCCFLLVYPLRNFVGIVTAEKVNAHVMQKRIEFFILYEIITVDPHTHFFALSMARFNDFSGQFHR
jgi:hypothetical protein